MQNVSYIFGYQIYNLHICINKNATGPLTPCGKKKKNERTLYCKTVNWRLWPPCLLLGTKIAGKLFFTAYSNNLIYKDIIFGLNRCSFIFPNQTIATISPSDSLIVECYVSPNDIGYLQIGKAATFQVDAYNYNQWGLANGRIIDISNQPYQEGKTVYFKVKCQLYQNSLFLKSGYEGRLKNGLTLTSRFRINRRSLYDLLFDKADDWLNPKIMTAMDE